VVGPVSYPPQEPTSGPYQPSPYPPNWYDDPYSSDHYRYWDGTSWTGHVSPKYATSNRPSTPDGVPLASWWQRVGARLLDQLIVTLISIPLAGYFYYRYFTSLNDLMQQSLHHPRTPPNAFALPWEVYKWLLVAAVVSVAVAVIYEVVFLRRNAATPGKRIVGLRVRQRDAEGPLPMSVIGRRVAVMYGLGVLALIPLVGLVAGLLSLLNDLWPLWDSKKQAWHDKAAGTNVVST
jgi:uncharacterized RDD family membrane protein YckC